MLGIIGQRAQVIGVADGGDGDAVFAGARNDGVQRRHGDDGAQAALAIDAEEGARRPLLVAGGAGHRQRRHGCARSPGAGAAGRGWEWPASPLPGTGRPGCGHGPPARHWRSGCPRPACGLARRGPARIKYPIGSADRMCYALPVNGKTASLSGGNSSAGRDRTADRLIARPSGLAEEVYRRIRADIMSLRMPPDTRVSVDSLARELGVSQTPIREALSMLEANGLVSQAPLRRLCHQPAHGPGPAGRAVRIPPADRAPCRAQGGRGDGATPTWRRLASGEAAPSATTPLPTWTPNSTA